MSDKFAFGLFDLDWDVFTQHIEGAINRVPVLAKTGVKSTVCGPGEWGALGAAGACLLVVRRLACARHEPGCPYAFSSPLLVALGVGTASLFSAGRRPMLGRHRNLPPMSTQPGFSPPPCEHLLMAQAGLLTSSRLVPGPQCVHL